MHWERNPVMLAPHFPQSDWPGVFLEAHHALARESEQLSLQVT